jgi:anti-sigma factor RsiW
MMHFKNLHAIVSMLPGLRTERLLIQHSDALQSLLSGELSVDELKMLESRIADLDATPASTLTWEQVKAHLSR